MRTHPAFFLGFSLGTDLKAKPNPALFFLRKPFFSFRVDDNLIPWMTADLKSITEEEEGGKAVSMRTPMAVNFATAGLGGSLAWVVAHPLNTLSVRMNLASLGAQSQRQGFFAFSRQLVAREGVLSLYSGLSAGLTRQLFYATSRLGLYDFFRERVAARRGGSIDFGTRLAVGVASGVCAAAISSPAEVCLVRMSNDMALPEAQRRNYGSIATAFSRILVEEGLPVFWRGCQALMMRAAIVGASQVGMNDQFQEVYRSWGVPSGPLLVASASMTAGLVYSVVSNPFETVKNRMAFQRPDQHGALRYRSPLQTLVSVARSDGPRALWHGFIPYYLRSGGHTVLMFLFVDRLRTLYQSSTSSNRASSSI